MPGKPKTRAAFAKLDAMEDEIFERIANGEYIQDVAESCEVSRWMFYNWLDAGGDERRERRDEAREMAGDAMVEDAGKILDDLADDDVPPTTADVTLAKERASHKRWTAGKFNKRYSDNPQIALGVQIGIGDAHLESLLKFGRDRQELPIELQRQACPELFDPDYEEADYELLPQPEEAKPEPPALDAVEEFDDLPDTARLSPISGVLTSYAGTELANGPGLVKVHPQPKKELTLDDLWNKRLEWTEEDRREKRRATKAREGGHG